MRVLSGIRSEIEADHVHQDLSTTLLLRYEGTAGLCASSLRASMPCAAYSSCVAQGHASEDPLFFSLFFLRCNCKGVISMGEAR